MKIQHILVAMMLACSSQALAQERAMEMRADRTLIYPQRLELKGDETLGDILAIYPDLMQNGFDDMLSGYNVRIDNVAINGDMRIVCRQLKARQISKIQICDNTAVAKGTVGLGRVIDITLAKDKKGLDGLAGVEAGTDHLADAHAVVRDNAAKTDVIAITSYSYQDFDDAITQKQHLFAHMTNYFSPKDRLLTYVSQQYQNTRSYDASGKEKVQNEKLMARALYFHTFNDQGTELLLVANYQYGNTPYTTYINGDEPLTQTRSDATIFIVELNTPLTKRLDMMAGWEGDFSYNHFKRNIGQGNTSDYLRTRYTSSNNDLYLQFNYVVGSWRFTVGDRVVFYHYSTPGAKSTDRTSTDEKWVRNDTRNNIEVSAISTLGKHSQAQTAYHRKFINPSFAIDQDLSYEDWLDIKQGLVARYIDETKLGYNYSLRNLNFSLAAYYQMIENEQNRCRLNAAMFYRTGILALSAGANLYLCEGDGNDFATFHLNPRLTLPWQMKLNVQSIFATGRAKLSRGEDVYLSGQLTKQWGAHWNVALEWHDICSSHYSAGMATVQYLF